MRTIKQIKAEMSELREQYEGKISLLEKEARAVRAARGFTPKVKPFEPYFEAGRSQEPTHH